MLANVVESVVQAANSTGGTVLVASRIASIRERLRELILRHDASAIIEETASGQEVLAIFKRRPPSIAVIDVLLDDLSGAEAVAKAKTAGLQAGELILMSPRVHEGWVEICQELEAYEFLRTPLDPAHISRLLRENALRFKPIQSLLVVSTKQERQFVWRALKTSRFTFQIEEADSSAHACKQLQLVPFDIAFIDFDLAGRDGLEAACQLRAISASTRLVLMASHDAQSLVQTARHCGVSLIMKKPFSALDLDVALHEVLEMRRPYLLNALLPKSAVVHVPPLKLVKLAKPVVDLVAMQA